MVHWYFDGFLFGEAAPKIRPLSPESSGDPQLQDPCSASEHHGAGEGGDVAVRGGHRRGLQRTRKGRDLVNLGATGGMFHPVLCG